MLLRRDALDAIVRGDVDLVFRLWKKPTVKAGGRLRTAVGELAIDAVEIAEPAGITGDEARRAGFETADEVRAFLQPRPTTGARTRTARPDETSRVYRVTVHFAGADPRVALRSDTSQDAIAAVVARLDKLDAAKRGPWTSATLALIGMWPARRAPELAEMLGMQTLPFKESVRKLKALGLTESLPVGYRLSPRGAEVLRVRPV